MENITNIDIHNARKKKTRKENLYKSLVRPASNGYIRELVISEMGGKNKRKIMAKLWCFIKIVIRNNMF